MKKKVTLWRTPAEEVAFILCRALSTLHVCTRIIDDDGEEEEEDFIRTKSIDLNFRDLLYCLDFLHQLQKDDYYTETIENVKTFLKNECKYDAYISPKEMEYIWKERKLNAQPEA